MRLLNILFVFSLAILLAAVAFNTGKLNQPASLFGTLTADGVRPVPWLTADGVRPVPWLTADGVRPVPWLTADGVRPVPWRGVSA
jgi:hypothetical protein